jgi:hypothetical protein
MALHAMVQPGTAETMLGDPMLADLGTLARFLVACPETAIGTRLWRETPADVAVALSRYRERCLALLRKKPATGDRPNELRPARLRLSPGARAMWVAFHDEVERDLNGGLAPVRAFGAKLAEHAARIAGVLCLAEDPDAAEVGGRRPGGRHRRRPVLRGRGAAAGGRRHDPPRPGTRRAAAGVAAGGGHPPAHGEGLPARPHAIATSHRPDRRILERHRAAAAAGEPWRWEPAPGAWEVMRP